MELCNKNMELQKIKKELHIKYKNTKKELHIHFLKIGKTP